MCMGSLPAGMPHAAQMVVQDPGASRPALKAASAAAPWFSIRLEGCPRAQKLDAFLHSLAAGEPGHTGVMSSSFDAEGRLVGNQRYRKASLERCRPCRRSSGPCYGAKGDFRVLLHHRACHGSA